MRAEPFQGKQATPLQVLRSIREFFRDTTPGTKEINQRREKDNPETQSARRFGESLQTDYKLGVQRD
jgi:hypothetical protein